jgi:hypothetical protein
MDAGGTCLSASCSKSTLPVERSTRIADFAEKLIPSAKAVVPKAKTRQRARIAERNFFIFSPQTPYGFFVNPMRKKNKKFCFCNPKSVFCIGYHTKLQKRGGFR